MKDFESILKEATAQMNSALQHLEKEFVKLRAGRASASMLSSVNVDYYGNSTPLNQVANIGTPDAMTISIQPWEKSLIPEIEKAIINSNLGFAPSNNGENVIINVPPLTEDRRKEIAKMAKIEVENAKVSIRTARKDANTAIKNMKDVSEDLIKDYETKIQELTDDFSKKTEEAYAVKEKEIMTV